MQSKWRKRTGQRWYRWHNWQSWHICQTQVVSHVKTSTSAIHTRKSFKLVRLMTDRKLKAKPQVTTEIRLWSVVKRMIDDISMQTIISTSSYLYIQVRFHQNYLHNRLLLHMPMSVECTSHYCTGIDVLNTQLQQKKTEVRMKYAEGRPKDWNFERKAQGLSYSAVSANKVADFESLSSSRQLHKFVFVYKKNPRKKLSPEFQAESTVIKRKTGFLVDRYCWGNVDLLLWLMYRKEIWEGTRKVDQEPEWIGGYDFTRMSALCKIAFERIIYYWVSLKGDRLWQRVWFGTWRPMVFESEFSSQQGLSS